jgi:hypothetical protein
MPEPADTLPDVERSRLDALVRGDIERADALHAEDFQLINPAGEPFSKKEYLDMIASGKLRYVLWEPGEITVRMHGRHAAVIRYRSVIEGVVAGRPIPRSRYWHTDTYELREGRWQVVWSQATETDGD